MPQEPPKCPYREIASPLELREHLLCAWTIGPATGGDETALPDGCIDIMWGENRPPMLAGPETGPVPSTRPAGTTVVGASFHPGAAPPILGVPADEIRDLRVPLTEVWGRDAAQLEQSVNHAESPTARLRQLANELRRRLKRAESPDPVVGAAVAHLRQSGIRGVATISEELGISERQLRRRFHAAVGYGPKTLARVLRFQQMLDLARQRRSSDLGQLALDAGYADQAHMTSECTRLAGLPPARLLAERYLLPTRS
jgi:AraC-like DNA-binding protein